MNNCGKNTLCELNLNGLYYQASSLLGIWFAEKELNFPYHFEYEIDDTDFLVVDNLEELTAEIYNRIQKIEEVSDYELFDNQDKLVELMNQVREDMIEDGYTGIWINNDSENDCTSYIVMDINCIK